MSCSPSNLKSLSSSSESSGWLYGRDETFLVMPEPEVNCQMNASSPVSISANSEVLQAVLASDLLLLDLLLLDLMLSDLMSANSEVLIAVLASEL